MGVVIREVENDSDLFAVGKLRYEVTVQEMQLNMQHADHHNKVVIEPLDYCGHVFVVFSDGEIVGTMRQNLVKEGDVGDYFDAYGISQLPAKDTNQVSVTTRLVIKESHRRSKVSLLLPVYGYNFLLRNGITHDVIDSRPNLISFFTKLGYRTHLHSWGHPEFGDVVVQYLDVEDELHLRNVGSPFAKHLREHRQSESSGDAVIPTPPDSSA